MSPTKRQMDVLRFALGYQLAKGESPGIREIVDGIGVRSTGRVHEMLVGLEERGLITRERRLARCADRSIELHADIAIPRSPTGEPLYFVSVP